MRGNYHTALKVKGDIQKDLTPVHRFEIGGNIAFTHNLTDGVPDEYKLCDVLYTETSWKDGQNTFNERAGVVSEWEDYMKALGAMITELGVPACVVTGKRGLRLLPPLPSPECAPTIMLNGAKAYLACYGENPNQPTAKATIQWLAQRYSTVGDPSCGYGRTGSIFMIAGKQYVMSDYNGKCIAYINRLHTELGKALWTS